ncbi:MAG: hypothetical protein IJV15_07825 [Lachnospiraceae bacterium]|nr:hypothetical protein [Lachnospiraceae bacterium]
MNNKGQITVFLCLIITAFLFVGMTALGVCKYFAGKEEAAIAVNSAVSDIKSEYNSYIFEHYHILLFDKTDYGKGEAAVEEEFYENVKLNLNSDCNVNSVAITDYDLITDNNCEALKSQINDYIVYAGIEYGASEILGKTKGKDANINEETINDMDRDCESDESLESDESDEDDTSKKEKDPRNFTKKLGKLGIIYYVIPEGLYVNDEIIDLSECPSKPGISFMDGFDIDNNFNSYSKLKRDLKKNSEWNSALVDAGCGLAYAKNVFNCAVNTDINDNTVFDFELEYLICGDCSDYNNLNKTIKKIIAIRFPIDFTYLLTDTSKMSRVKTIALALNASTGIPYPIMKYLIAGCWSYVEAAADVKVLLKGEKLPFEKSYSSWMTDIDNFGDSLNAADTDNDEGMSYEDYLAILMALNMDKTYKRMLDLMQLNAGQIYPEFLMENAAVGLSADVSISYAGSVFDFNISGGY